MKRPIRAAWLATFLLSILGLLGGTAEAQFSGPSLGA